MGVLQGIDPHVSDSRKGRYWELASGCVVLTVSVLDTKEHHFGHELLEEQGLTYSEAPDIVVIACSVRDSGAALCSQLAHGIAVELGGVSLGLTD